MADASNQIFTELGEACNQSVELSAIEDLNTEAAEVIGNEVVDEFMEETSSKQEPVRMTLDTDVCSMLEVDKIY